MTNINVSEIAANMLAAAARVLKGKAPIVTVLAENEFHKIAVSIDMIGRLRAAGTITDGEAALQMEIQRNASRAALCAVEGISLLAAEEAINAALDVVRGAVNAILGFKLL